VLPYLQLFLLADYKEQHDSSGKFLIEGTYFWVPTVLGITWLAVHCGGRSAGADSAAEVMMASDRSASANQ
jgi:hypothetical protein